MEYCKGCIFYCKELDDLLTLTDDESEEENHFCEMYKDGIDKEIWKGSKKCEKFFSKKEALGGD